MSQTDVATASPTQGEGDGEITIEMTPNTTMANRSVNMTIQSENKTHMAIVKIKQPKVDAAVDIDKTSFTFDGTGGNAILKISCNTAWEIRDIPSWLKFSSTSGYKDAEITITALPSNQATQRKAVLGVVAAEQARTYLIVTQERGISTRQVAVNQFVTLRQSAAFTFNQGEDVEWFIYDILPKETVESLDDQALSLQLHMSGIIGEQEPSTIYWDTGLEPGREYAICAISSDINDDEEPAPHARSSQHLPPNRTSLPPFSTSFTEPTFSRHPTTSCLDSNSTSTSLTNAAVSISSAIPKTRQTYWQTSPTSTLPTKCLETRLILPANQTST